MVEIIAFFIYFFPKCFFLNANYIWPTLFVSQVEIIKNCYWNSWLGWSNRHNQKIKQHPSILQYPLINYLSHCTYPCIKRLCVDSQIKSGRTDLDRKRPSSGPAFGLIIMINIKASIRQTIFCHMGFLTVWDGRCTIVAVHCRRNFIRSYPITTSNSRLI